MKGPILYTPCIIQCFNTIFSVELLQSLSESDAIDHNEAQHNINNDKVNVRKSSPYMKDIAVTQEEVASSSAVTSCDSHRYFLLSMIH